MSRSKNFFFLFRFFCDCGAGTTPNCCQLVPSTSETPQRTTLDEQQQVTTNNNNQNNTNNNTNSNKRKATTTTTRSASKRGKTKSSAAASSARPRTRKSKVRQDQEKVLEAGKDN